jgi:hypothetical protein
VPGTFNWKYDRPRPVVLVSTRPGAIDVDELDDFLPRETPASKASLSEGTIPQGMRNDWLFRLGRSLRARQLPANTIVGTLETLNATRCRPPLPGEELKYLLHQVFTLPHRPDFHPPRPHGCHGLAGREPGKPEGTRP